MDVTSEAEVNTGVKSVIEAFGTINTLVSNAGIQIVHPIENFPFRWKSSWRSISMGHFSPPRR